MPDYHLVPVDHDPFAGGAPDQPSVNQWGQPLVQEVSPLERYKFQPDVPEAVKRATPDYGIVARGQKQGGHYSEMTPAEQEAYQRGFIHAAGAGISFINPALGASIMATKGVAEDDPGAIAASAVPFAAARFPKTAAAAVGTYLGATPAATGGGLIDSLDPKERPGYVERLKRANANLTQAKGIRNPDQRNQAVIAAQAAVDAINKEISDKVGNRADAERKMANDQAVADKWLNDRAADIDSLGKERAASIRGAPPGDRAAMLSKFLEDKRKAGMTTAETYRDILDPIRYGLGAAAVGIPGKMAFSRAGTVAQSAAEAKAAWDALKQGRTTAAKEGRLLAARNDLAQQSTLSPFDAKEALYGGTAMWGLNSLVPASVDIVPRLSSAPMPTWLGGSGQSSNPDDWDLVKRAAYGAALGLPLEFPLGAAAAAAGRWGGGALRDFDAARNRARGTLDTINPTADAIARKFEGRANGGRLGAATAPAGPVLQAQPAGVVSSGSLGAATAPKYPDWATTPALKRKYTMDQKKAAAQKNSTP